MKIKELVDSILKDSEFENVDMSNESNAVDFLTSFPGHDAEIDSDKIDNLREHLKASLLEIKKTK